MQREITVACNFRRCTLFVHFFASLLPSLLRFVRHRHHQFSSFVFFATLKNYVFFLFAHRSKSICLIDAVAVVVPFDRLMYIISFFSSRLISPLNTANNNFHSIIEKLTSTRADSDRVLRRQRWQRKWTKEIGSSLRRCVMHKLIRS